MSPLKRYSNFLSKLLKIEKRGTEMVSISRTNAEKVEVAFDNILFGTENFALISIGNTGEITISKHEDGISCAVRYSGVSIIIDDCILAGISADNDYLLIIGTKSDIQIPIRK